MTRPKFNMDFPPDVLDRENTRQSLEVNANYNDINTPNKQSYGVNAISTLKQQSPSTVKQSQQN